MFARRIGSLLFVETINMKGGENMRALFLVVALVILPASASPSTWYILPDGTGDAPTIQAGVDSSSVGDTVLVAPGTYYENVFSTVQDLVLISESGPNQTTIDGGGAGRCVYVEDCSLVEGFTIQNGNDPYGGGVLLYGSGELVDLVVIQNVAEQGGGVLIMSKLGHPNGMRECLIAGNTASVEGGGIYAASGGDFSDVTIRNCTVDNNGAPAGGNIYCSAEPTLWGWIEVSNCISSNSQQGEGIYLTCELLVSGVICCDVWNNAGGSYGGHYAYPDPTGTNGNICVDPQFCDPGLADYSLEGTSPCLPGNHPDGADCGLIGAYGAGCTPTAVDPPVRATWGSIKAKYE
jgi:hypothetical protein